MQPLEELEHFLREQGVESGPLLLALSGGADSTALALLLTELSDRFPVEAAHINHHLRGDESDDDERFVRDLCRDLSIPLHVVDGRLDPAVVRTLGIEAAAREVRYRALRAIASDRNIPWIATAHHRDDQVETLLLRLFTGHGVHRLSGIAPRSHDLLRPLLRLTRAALEEVVASRGYEARRDSSNDDRRFVRNVIRHDILPMIRRINPAADAAIAHTAADARATIAALSALATPEEERWRVRDSGAVRFLDHTRPKLAVVRRMILLREIARLDPAGSREISAADLVRIDAQMPELRRVHITRHLEMLRRGGEIVVRSRSSAAPRSFAASISPGTTIDLPEIDARVTLRELKNAPADLRPSAGRQVFQLPPGSSPSFSLRSRRPGDRFHPFGSPGEKKLKDFLIDRKIPKERRDRLPLLVCGNRIVCVAGVEVSELFKVSDRSQPLFEIEIEYSDKQERP